MPTPALVALGIALACYLLVAPLRRALAVLLAVEVLIPGSLVLPNGLSSYPTVTRVALVAVTINVVRRWRRGDLSDDAWRWSPAHVALGAMVLLALISGVLLATPEVSTWNSLHGWVILVDQLVLLVVATAIFRSEPDSRWVLRAIGAVVVLSAAVAVVEHLTGGSWGHWLFEHRSSQRGLDAANPLDVRAGHTRVRAGAEFALAFAWVTVMLLPALLVWVAELRGRARALTFLLPALVAAAAFWSYSRSPLPFIALGLLAAWVGTSFARPIGWLLVAGAVAALGVAALAPDLTDPLTAEGNQATVELREERLPHVAALVAERPLQGMGLGGLDQAGIPTTDASYQQLFGELGVPGLTWSVVMALVALAYAARSLRAPAGPERAGGAALTAAVLIGVVGAASFDLFAVSGAAAVFWILVAAAGAIGERAQGAAHVRVDQPAFSAFVLAGVLLGLIVALAGPRHVVASARYPLLTVTREVVADHPPFFADEVLRRTACGAVTAYGRATPGVDVACREVGPQTGVTEVRVDASSVDAVRNATDDITAIIKRQAPPGVAEGAFGSARRVRPTWVATAPAWGALLGLALALFGPRPRLRWRPRWARVAPTMP